MGPEQWLFLQWHEHKGSLVSTFEKLFERNTFVDCTLAAEGQYLNVHKMILSACSPYFEILLNENRDKHPIIILKDVKFRSLKSIIEYMYRGEANVLSTEMTDFLAAAETLQIKGIGKQGGGDTRTQPKNLRDLMEEQSRPPCPTMQIIKEEKDNWADSDLSSALTETVQDSFVTQNAVLFSQGDAGATIALPQKLPKAEAAAEEAEAAAPGLGSHTEPVRPAAPPADWAGAASAGDAGPLEAAPKAEADADLPAPAPPPAPAPAPRPPPADMEDAETASLGSSVIELSDTTEEWAEEEDMDEGQAAHAHALAPAAEESRARFEAASDVARDSASRDLGSEQETESVAAGEVILNQLLSVQRCLQLHIQASSKGCNTASAKGSNVAPNVGSNAPAAKPPPPAAEPKPDRPSKPPRREHPPPGPPPAPVYVCPQCHKSFPWLCYLKRHLRTHSGDTVYMCKDCGFRTRKYSEFTMHQRAHNWDRSYRKGDHDDPQPSRRGGQSHQHSHTAKRPSSNKPDFIQAHPHGFSKHFKGFVPQKRMYKCPKCDLMLDSKEDLVKHLNTVHNPKKSSSETSCESCMSRSDSSSGTVYRQETRCRQLIKPESAPLLCRTRLPPVPEVHPRMIRSRTVL